MRNSCPVKNDPRIGFSEYVGKRCECAKNVKLCEFSKSVLNISRRIMFVKHNSHYLF
jgi:hypothetical protein